MANFSDPIAIVGMACQFPGAADIDSFWQNLIHDDKSISTVPADRWCITDYFDEYAGTPGKTYTKYGGFIGTIAEFDYEFFNIPKRLANQLDPQHRMLLQVSWHAFEHAGIKIDREKSIDAGVFLAIGGIDYTLEKVRSVDDSLSGIDAQMLSGSEMSLAANRISQFYNLTGPSLSLNSACSSVSVALHYASMSLIHDECQSAIVAGVSLLTSPIATIALCQSWILSSQSNCLPFDKNADGYCRGEGCGVVILKTLSTAIKEGHHIYGVVKSSGINHNGYTEGDY